MTGRIWFSAAAVKTLDGIMSRKNWPASIDLGALPTMAEAGIPAAELTTWIGVMAPAKLPPAIAKKIHEEFTAAVKDPKVIKQLADIGCDVDPTTMENFDRLVQSENARWGAVVRQNNITAD